jgi:diguanylate cyclase (GGDEF)-like protein
MMNDTKQSILIADVEKSSLLDLNHILSNTFDITFAKSGEAALRLACEQLPDLILLNASMPDMSGCEVLRRLKEDEKTRNIPVIFIIDQDSFDEEEEGFISGAADCIRKPYRSTIVKVKVVTQMHIVRQLQLNKKLGTVDPLTGIANRRRFDDRILLEWQRSVRMKSDLALLMLDLDNFKEYNDAHGHLQGDALIKYVSTLFTSHAKRSTDLVARLGGEEFSIMLPGTDLEGAMHIAENIRFAVEQSEIPTLSGKEMTSITVSVGVNAIIPTSNDALLYFISKADSNLNMAKQKGRNRIYSPLDES